MEPCHVVSLRILGNPQAHDGRSLVIGSLRSGFIELWRTEDEGFFLLTGPCMESLVGRRRGQNHEVMARTLIVSGHYSALLIGFVKPPFFDRLREA